MKTSRNQNVELVRILAAFGIVVFHSGATGSALGYSGLVAFTMLATFFAGNDLAKLAKRVLVPWAFWSVFYLGWRFVADGDPFHPGMNPIASILYGTHLWFLPFVFVVIGALGAVKTDHLPLICGCAAFGLLAATPWWREFQVGTPPPVIQALHALPAAFAGVALRDRFARMIVVAGLAICLAWSVPGVSIPYAVGGGAVIGALLLPRIRVNVEVVSRCTMGIYLVHIAALGVFNLILGPKTLATAMAAFLGSFAGVWIARRILPQTRIVLG